MSRQVVRIIEQERKMKSGRLDLSNRKLEFIPLEISKLNWLLALNLSGNQIRKIEELEKLTQLTELNLSGNKIRKIECLKTLSKKGMDEIFNLTTLSDQTQMINKTIEILGLN